MGNLVTVANGDVASFRRFPTDGDVSSPRPAGAIA